MSVELAWFKSSYSNDQGGACLEVALSWFKSSHSDDQGGNCVEVATCAATVHVRDSKLARSPQLALTATAWATFLASVSGA